jgi:hypothetical protein
LTDNFNVAKKTNTELISEKKKLISNKEELEKEVATQKKLISESNSNTCFSVLVTNQGDCKSSITQLTEDLNKAKAKKCEKE